MGLWSSYCKSCNCKLNWFMNLEYGHITCPNCSEVNLEEDVKASMNNKNYWKMFYRNKKINKIINAN